jgi:hypothetical protein
VSPELKQIPLISCVDQVWVYYASPQRQTDKGGLQRHTTWSIMLSGGLCATTGGEQTDLLDSING